MSNDSDMSQCRHNNGHEGASYHHRRVQPAAAEEEEEGQSDVR